MQRIFTGLVANRMAFCSRISVLTLNGQPSSATSSHAAMSSARSTDRPELVLPKWQKNSLGRNSCPPIVNSRFSAPPVRRGQPRTRRIVGS